MKKITAFVRPNMIDDVIIALHQVDDFPGATMTDARTIVRGIHQHQKEKCEAPCFGHPPLIRIEIVCSEQLTDEIVKTIAEAAHTGRHGDGQIYTSPIDSELQIEMYK